MAKRIQDPTRNKGQSGPGLTVQDAIWRAVSLHRDGALDAAETLYRRVLAVAANEPNALHFLGVLKHQRGEHEKAIELIRRSLRALPGNADFHSNLGNVLAGIERREEAAAAYRAALAVKPDHANALCNLGAVQRSLGHVEEAEALYRRALEIDPNHLEAHRNLGNLLSAAGRHEEAVAVFWKKVLIDPKRPESRRLLALAHYANGDVPKALEVLEAWLADEPNDPVARHMHAACSGDGVPERASDAYIEQTFDRFAASFDARLEALNYRAPGLVAEALGRIAGEPAARLDILDAGCGTGLCGPLLKPFARSLVGVDLSAAMLAEARRRRTYDELVRGELSAVMKGRAGSFDAVVSADTLIYFGVLDDVLSAAATALRAGGFFVFTLESCAEPAEAGYRLNAHGRYSHRRDYVVACLSRAGFDPVSIVGEDLRQEAGKPVPGLLVSASLRPRSPRTD